ncbi:thiol:disulfide interchange protein [Polynucleobacter sp. SHI8]|uniref:thiol:disulfide interchange protein DsbA/DsbL n=1 Tax=unclassified Polynucleobacter TaxID=2640945 RepID=UPI00308E7AB0|nr:thiol:disulfide interchange protein [Polynucleobacter sp. SHI2]BDW14638.1 thiol:disulfide interchange protein [Polynucleobacter sp. SHI8]
MKQCKKILMSMLILAGSILTVQAQLLPPGTASKNTPSNSPSNSAFMEGLDYKLLSSPQPTESKGKIEVTEFFWYACPHCYDLEPEIQAWVKRQKNDVVFKRVPIAFRDDFLPHSQIFYALEALGKEAEYSPKVMKAIHVDRKQMLKEDEIFNWATSVGLDTAAFTTAYKSFSVQTKAKTANATGSAYRVNGVPTIFVQGKYETSPSIAGTKARAIDTLDYLVGKARTEKK